MNPLWIDSFKVKYIPCAQQELLFEVWDDDYPDKELIGVCEVLFQDIMVAQNGCSHAH